MTWIKVGGKMIWDPLIKSSSLHLPQHERRTLLSRRETSNLENIAYETAREEGASIQGAKEAMREPWRWLNRDGSSLPMSDAPRLKKPAWWPK